MDGALDRLIEDTVEALPSAGLTRPTPAPARIERFLTGRTYATGLFQDRSGRVRRRFTATLDGVSDGAALSLAERFVFDDGEQEARNWRIQTVGETGYAATADDMIGAAHGELKGEQLRWSYLFSLKIGARRFRVRFDETFLMLDAETMLNCARVSKFGIEVGRTTILFRRTAPGA